MQPNHQDPDPKRGLGPEKIIYYDPQKFWGIWVLSGPPRTLENHGHQAFTLMEAITPHFFRTPQNPQK